MSGINYNLDGYGRSALFVPAYVGKNLRVAELLQDNNLRNEINTTIRSQGAQNLLHISCYGSSNKETVQLLVANGADIMALDLLKRLPLHIAANSARYEILAYLLDVYKARNPAAIQLVDANNRSLVHSLCCLGSSASEKAHGEELSASLGLILDLFDDLAAKKAALLQLDAFGLRPIDYAKYFGLEELREDFAKYGINWDEIIVSKDNKGYTDYFGRNDAMQLAFSYTSNQEILTKNVQALQVALNEPGNDPNNANLQFGARNTLHYAVGGGNPELVTVVLDDSRTQPLNVDNSGNSAIHLAAHRGNFNVLLALFAHANHGATFLNNINNTNIFNENPLHMLALSANGNEERYLFCAEELVKFGVDLQAKNINLDTPAVVAKKRGNDKLAAKLEQLAQQKTMTMLYDTLPKRDSLADEENTVTKSPKKPTSKL